MHNGVALELTPLLLQGGPQLGVLLHRRLDVLQPLGQLLLQVGEVGELLQAGVQLVQRVPGTQFNTLRSSMRSCQYIYLITPSALNFGMLPCFTILLNAIVHSPSIL